MPVTVQVQCAAKVNLFLEVTGRRRDGYHRLATLFSKISIFDVLDASATDEGFELEVVDEVGQAPPGGPENLVWRAAAAFRRRFRVRRGAKLRLTKRIPMGAGLGGGSSDAAGTLLALSRLYGMTENRGIGAALRSLAVGLGADIPFFLHPVPMCDGRGIGEKLKAVRPAKALPWMVLVFPGVSVGTPEVFGRLALPGRKAVSQRLSQLDTLKKI